jgi:hypothetical protein
LKAEFAGRIAIARCSATKTSSAPLQAVPPPAAAAPRTGNKRDRERLVHLSYLTLQQQLNAGGPVRDGLLERLNVVHHDGQWRKHLGKQLKTLIRARFKDLGASNVHQREDLTWCSPTEIVAHFRCDGANFVVDWHLVSYVARPPEKTKSQEPSDAASFDEKRKAAWREAGAAFVPSVPTIKVVPEFSPVDPHILINGRTAAVVIHNAISKVLKPQNLALLGAQSDSAKGLVLAIVCLMLQVSTQHFMAQALRQDEFNSFVRTSVMSGKCLVPKKFPEALVALLDFGLLPSDFRGGFAATTDGGSLHLIATIKGSHKPASPASDAGPAGSDSKLDPMGGGADVGNTSIEAGFVPEDLMALERRVTRLEARIAELRKSKKVEGLQEAIQELERVRSNNTEKRDAVLGAGKPKGGRITRGLLDSELRVKVVLSCFAALDFLKNFFFLLLLGAAACD